MVNAHLLGICHFFFVCGQIGRYGRTYVQVKGRWRGGGGAIIPDFLSIGWVGLASHTLGPPLDASVSPSDKLVESQTPDLGRGNLINACLLYMLA